MIIKQIINTGLRLITAVSILFGIASLPFAGIAQSDNYAGNTTIIRDRWGVPHIYAKTDRQCTFGLMYAQCEDNYWQLEETMIRNLGRAAEVYGTTELGNDAEVALFECRRRAQNAYDLATPELRGLCDAAAAGINYYLRKNPSVPQRLIHHYEPWFFLLSSPNSAADHGITGKEMRGILADNSGAVKDRVAADTHHEITGSNTLAISGKKTTGEKSILVINPHVPFFGQGQRYEAHMVSKEGLNVSGFAILGTFYIWSGFTDRTAWAHTNTASDNQDVYLEKINPTDSSQYYYDGGVRKLITWTDTVYYKSGSGMSFRVFRFRKTHHGPVVAQRTSFLVTVKSALDGDPGGYIMQAVRMCKARNLKEFTGAISLVQLATNTMYSDREGNIAYWHGSKIPIRDTQFNWRLPVDGSVSQTEWKGYHTAKQIIHLVNPSSGFLQNCNSSPFLAAGDSFSIKAQNYPRYMAYDEQNLRSQEMLLQMSLKQAYSPGDAAEIITSKNLPVMRNWLKDIIADYETEAKVKPSIRTLLGDVIDTLRNWDCRYSLTSTATTLAYAWHTEYLSWLRKQNFDANPAISTWAYYNGTKLLTPPGVSTTLLATAVKDVKDLYGTPFVPWQVINRLQRRHTSGREKFSDSLPSIAVNAAPGIMGSLFAFNIKFEQNTAKGYGVSGNTYTAIVAFDKRVKARSVVTFGQSSDSSSGHYFDQAELYAKGQFKDALYYRDDVLKGAEEIYHPGERSVNLKK